MAQCNSGALKSHTMFECSAAPSGACQFRAGRKILAAPPSRSNGALSAPVGQGRSSGIAADGSSMFH